MKLVDITCPSCGAVLHVDGVVNDKVKCEYCSKEFILDDEVKRVEHTVKNAEQAGYDFEKGRIKAAQEEIYWQHKTQELGYDPRYQKDEKRKNILLKVILWVFFFPIMLGYKVISSKKLEFEAKVFIILIMIGAIAYFMSGGRLWS